MRSRLLDAAAERFMARGLAKVTVAEVAQAVGAFPSQVTYYFRSKDALFVEAACRQVLYLARAIEERSRGARTAAAYRVALIDGTVGTPGMAFFLEALALARHHPSLHPQIARTVERLHREGERAFAQMRTLRRWRATSDDAVVARRFWALAMAISLRDGALGFDGAASRAEARRLLADDFGDAAPRGARRLRVVDTKETGDGRRSSAR